MELLLMRDLLVLALFGLLGALSVLLLRATRR